MFLSLPFRYLLLSLSSISSSSFFSLLFKQSEDFYKDTVTAMKAVEKHLSLSELDWKTIVEFKYNVAHNEEFVKNSLTNTVTRAVCLLFLFLFLFSSASSSPDFSLSFLSFYPVFFSLQPTISRERAAQRTQHAIPIADQQTLQRFYRRYNELLKTRLQLNPPW
jgi:hypothetical protein